MSTSHEPRPEFIQRLQERVTIEAHRRQQPLVPRYRWMPQSPLAAMATLAAVVAVSMVAGGAVVAARYQAETQQQRDMLAATYQRRIELEQKKLDVAKAQWQEVQRRVQTGQSPQLDSIEAESQVRAAELQVHVAQLQLEEVRLTGKEPNDAVSAPVIAGRDFVRERWNVQVETIASSLDVAKATLAAAQKRFNVGLIDKAGLAMAESGVRAIELALGGARQRLDIRQQFVSNQIDAATADLRLLETDATLRRQTAQNQLDVAQTRLADATSRFEKGLVSRVDVSQAELRVIELQYEIKKADLELAVIRQQIAQRKGK